VSETPPRPPLERAEEIVHQLEERVGPFVARTLARAREEAEDVWAEIQSIRQSRRPSR
jgi:hypothetical protein